jgi:Uma2 family endonuclease
LRETLTLNIPPTIGLTDEQFYQLCLANDQWQIELTAVGELIIMPPTGGKTGIKNSDIKADLVIQVLPWFVLDLTILLNH